MNILVTAFMPFGGKDDNVSLAILNALKHVETCVLDVCFKEAFNALKQKNLDAYDYIIALGEAPYKKIHLEHLALNMMHASIPDNKGYQPQHIAIDPHSPMTYTSTLPLIYLGDMLTKNSLAFSHSYHAGTYVCNDLFYRLMHTPIQAERGFIHVPNDMTYFESSLMAIQKIIDAIKIKKG